MGAVHVLFAVICGVAFLTLGVCFVVAVVSRRFNIRVLLLATTAAAILTARSLLDEYSSLNDRVARSPEPLAATR